MIHSKTFTQFIEQSTAVVPPKKEVLPATKMAPVPDTSKAFSTPAPSGGYGGTAANTSKPVAFSPAPTSKPELTAAGNNQADLNALRRASASATMAGPSREAQALMSDRTKNILSGKSVYGGPNKLNAGIDAQVGVEKMKAAMSTPPPEPTKIGPAAQGGILARKDGQSGTIDPKTKVFTAGTFDAAQSARYDKMRGVDKLKSDAATVAASKASTPPPKTTTPSPTATPLTTQQQSMYDMARRNKGNPMIQARFNSLSPQEQAAFRAQAKADGVDFGF